MRRPYDNNGAARQKTPYCCVLGASFDSGNLGVNALAASTVAAIQDSFPGARVFFLDYGKSPARYQVRHDGGVTEVELVNLRFSWRVYLRNNIARLIATTLLLRLLPAPRLRERLIRQNLYLSRIQSADIVGSLAGGDSFSDIYGLRRLWYVGLPQLLVLFLGKPLVILPQTLGPFETRIARTLATFILRHAEQVFARDEQSLEAVRPLMGDRASRARLAFDMAFLLEPIAPVEKPEWLRKTSQSCPRVGVNVSGLLYHGGYSRDNMFGLKADYRELVRSIVRYFLEEEGAEVVLVPHVFGNEADLDSDSGACAEIHADFIRQHPQRVHLLRETYDQHEIKFLIGQCSFFLGSRMHACIAALSQCVPAVGLAYSGKFAGVLGSVGVENLVVDLRRCGAEDVLSRIRRAYFRRADTSRALVARIPSAKRSVAALFRGVCFEPRSRTRLPAESAGDELVQRGAHGMEN